MDPVLFGKIAPAIMAAGLLVSLAACRSGSAHQPTGPVSSTSSQPTANPGIPKSVFAGLESFTGPAVAKYGLTNVQAAYEEMVNFVFETGWNTALIRKNAAQLSSADFANARSYMTPAFRKAFDARFAKVVLGDKAAIQGLGDAVFFGVTPNGAKPVTAGHVVTDRRFTKVTTLAVDRSQGFDRLQLTFRARANIQLQDAAGKRYKLPAIRTVQYWLVKNTGPAAQVRPFLIDEWHIRLTPSPVQPAK